MSKKVFIIDDVFPVNEKGKIEKETGCEIICATSYEEADKIITETPEGEAIADLCICDCCFTHPLWAKEKEQDSAILQIDAPLNRMKVIQHFRPFLKPIKSARKDEYLAKLKGDKNDERYCLRVVLEDNSTESTIPSKYYSFGGLMDSILTAHYYLPMECGGPDIALKLKNRNEKISVFTSGIKHSFLPLMIMVGVVIISIDEVINTCLMQDENGHLAINSDRKFAMGGDKRVPETWIELIKSIL